MNNRHEKKPGKIERICFFGASVTAQESGYAKVLSDKWKKSSRCYTFGYGGMYPDDAGICYIDKVLEKHPDVCFIDWFSTDYNKCDEKTIEYLDTIVYKFTRAECKLVFLFMQYRNNPDKKAFYDFCTKYLLERKLFYIDIFSETKDIPKDELLRDNIHTTNYGSHIYANIIERDYKSIKDKIVFPINIRETIYTEIKHIDVKREFFERIILKGKGEIIGFNLLVGKHSGIVYISDGNRREMVNIWDKWCYYNRDHFRIRLALDGEVSILISDEGFDTTICKVPIDVSNIKKKLMVHSIYYIGEDLRVMNLKEGKRICYLKYKVPIWWRKCIGKMVKIVKGIKD